MDKRLYLAYGSNMNLQQMERRCTTAKVVGTGCIKNYRLRFNGVATIEPARGQSVPVVVWNLQPSDERSLDNYEGYPSFYYKKELTAVIGSEEIAAMAYIMVEGRQESAPPMQYYIGIEQGYKGAGLDLKPLKEAYRRAQRSIKRHK